jgi:AcrR family transcriptional regulator
MTAATDLLVEGGPEALTVDAVVARSGVAKSTIYRHWATRDDLVAAVFEDCAPDLQAPDPSLDAEQALRSLIHQLAATITDPRWRRLIPALILLKAQHEPVAHLEDDLSSRQTELLDSVLTRAVEDGVLARSVLEDLHATSALLAGPLIMGGVFDFVALTDDFVDQVVDQFLVAHRPPST